MNVMTKMVIVAAKRTPIGSFMGTLSGISAADLGVAAAKDVLSGVNSSDIADVIVGNVLQAGQGMNVARQIGRGAGVPDHVPGITINRVCGSGLQSLISGVQAARAGDGSLFLVGGTENMSRAPFYLPRVREGYRLGHAQAQDAILTDGLTDVFNNYHMGITAENIAEQWKLSREEQDAFAANSQERAAAALAGDFFKDELVSVEVKQRKETIQFAQDEYPRATTAEKLAKLRPAFKKDGTVTAGNASGINDGAAMLLLATEEYAKANGLSVVAEVSSYAVTGVDPTVMGIGPAKAVPLALEKLGLGVSDVDLFELNEAFAAQSLAVLRDLKADPDKVNVTGGAIALGHPIGASGARVLVTLIHQLRRLGKETGVASLCIGGGMGIAVVVKAR